MPYEDLREFLSKLEASGKLHKITKVRLQGLGNFGSLQGGL